MIENQPTEQGICYQASDRFICREIGGEIVLVPIGGPSAQINGFVTFNETGAMMWRMLSTPRTIDELAQALAAEYEATVDEVIADVREFMDYTLKVGIVVPCK